MRRAGSYTSGTRFRARPWRGDDDDTLRKGNDDRRAARGPHTLRPPHARHRRDLGAWARDRARARRTARTSSSPRATLDKAERAVAHDTGITRHRAPRSRCVSSTSRRSRACTPARDRLLAEGQPIHVLFANAGVMACPQGRTREGLRDADRHEPPRSLRVRRELARAAGGNRAHRGASSSPPPPGTASRTSISTTRTSSARPTIRGWPTVARRRPTRCSRSSSTGN